MYWTTRYINCGIEDSVDIPGYQLAHYVRSEQNCTCKCQSKQMFRKFYDELFIGLYSSQKESDKAAVISYPSLSPLRRSGYKDESS